MPCVTVHVDASEVLEEMSDEELRAELVRRNAKTAKELEQEEAYRAALLERIYIYFRGRCPCEALREYIGEVTGKIL